MYYVNTKTWAISNEATDGAIRVPFIALFILMPILGLAFLMFLPAIGFILVAHALAKRVMSACNLTMLAHTPAVGTAYLIGHELDGKNEATNLDEIEAEIKKRRS